jgi:FkbM family methyltransferase
MDGICYSNTKFFEDELQMSGTLIEPTSKYFSLVNNRPRCNCYNVAVNYKKEKVKFLGDHATAGLVYTMDIKFKNIHHPNSNEYYVDGEPISSILDKSNITYIDLITIDVEGGEEVVLKTMNFKIPIYLICIELDCHNIEKDERCRKILLDNGFLFHKRININEFWVNENYDRKELLFDETKKLNFTSNIYELGNFPHLEQHVVGEVEESLRNVN